MTGDWDAVVVGAGPAGSASAAHLARAGLRVALLDKETFPRDKLCGEFLSFDALGPLERLGALDAARAAGARPVAEARFVSARGREAVVPLPAPALCLTRRRLDSLLLERARAAGAAVFEGTRARPGPRPGVLLARGPDGVERPLAARLIVGAHGRREAPLDKGLGRGFAERPAPFVGLQRHLRPASAAGLEGRVELHFFDGGYCGLNEVEGGRVNACMLLESRLLKDGPSGWDAVCAELARRAPALGRRLAALEPCGEPPRAVAQVPFIPKEPAAGGALFVGDAAGVAAPLLGAGQALALRSAEALAQTVRDEGPEGAEGAWRRRWRRDFAGPLARGRWLQAALLRPAAAEALVAACAASPRLARALLALTR